MTDEELVEKLRRAWNHEGPEGLACNVYLKHVHLAADRIEALAMSADQWIQQNLTPAEYASARKEVAEALGYQRGLSEGLEMAAKWHEMQADSYEDKATYGGSHESEWSKRYNQKAENERYAATAIRALSPATQAKEQKEKK